MRGERLSVVNVTAPRLIRAAVTAAVVASIIAGAAPSPAWAQAAPTCRPGAGPVEYQAELMPFMGEAAPVPPAPPPEMALTRSSAQTTGGATDAAREALGAQFTLVWLSDTLQGWVVGVAPGPLDLAQARAAIVGRLAARFAPADVALLDARLYVDPQPYGEAQLRATQAGVEADLHAAAVGVGWSVAFGCELSDAIRVEVELFSDSTPEIVERVRAVLAPYGDRVRLTVSPAGPPVITAMPLMPGSITRPGQDAVAVRRYVSLARSSRCIRAARTNVAVRPEQRARVALLTVTARGRRRTISGARLRKPISVALTRRRTTVVIAVKLRDRRRGERTITFTRCG